MTENITPIDDRFIRSTEVRYRLGLSKTTFHRLRHRGVVPEPVRLGGNVYWPKSEIDSLINSLATNRTRTTSPSIGIGLEPSRRRKRKPDSLTQLRRTKEAS